MNNCECNRLLEDIVELDCFRCVTISETGTAQGESCESDLRKVLKTQKKKRPKTSKANRIAPTVDVQPRNCHTASTVHSDSDVQSSPDPFEPWSMKGIENMNKILAWENDQDSL